MGWGISGGGGAGREGKGESLSSARVRLHRNEATGRSGRHTRRTLKEGFMSLCHKRKEISDATESIAGSDARRKGKRDGQKMGASGGKAVTHGSEKTTNKRLQPSAISPALCFASG